MRSRPRADADSPLVQAGTVVLALLAALLLLVSFFYAAAPTYAFAPPRPFSGEAWYNPYDGIPDDHDASVRHARDGIIRGRWLKANFHAHSRAWGGVTNGAQPADSVVEAYARLRYDVVGVSNYESMASGRVADAFPVYEHGWNAFKAHHLVIGADRVTWLDYPLWQSRQLQQHMLAILRRSGGVVVLAHPRLRNARTPDDLRFLTDYDLMEVLNSFAPPAEAEWDAALSSGHPAWLLASDDSHDSRREREVGVNWVRLFAADGGTESVTDALRAGRAYALHGANGWSPLSLRSLLMRGDTLTVSVNGPVEDLRVIGQGGQVRTHVRFRTDVDTTGERTRGGTLSVVARAEDGYLRVVASGRDYLLYTNPVVRRNGAELVAPVATVDWPRTIRARFLWMLACSWGAARLFRFRRRERLVRATAES